MSFAFNFDIPEANNNDNDNDTDEKLTTKEEGASSDAKAVSDAKAAVSHPFRWMDNLESILEKRAQQEIIFEELKSLQREDDKEDSQLLKHVSIDQYEKEVKAGVYEGGLQIWEGSLDLVRFFLQDDNATMPAGSSCLELGCGHALPGCYLLRQALLQNQRKRRRTTTTDIQQQQFTFVDYNDYVINDVTLSNIVLNTADIIDARKLAPMLQLGFGDWRDMSTKLFDKKFDWIVAAEITYSPEACHDVAYLLLQHLVPITGIGWIATKRYYFGVGGGTDALKEAAQTLSDAMDSPHYLQIETAKVIDSGVGNIREILKVTCHVKQV